MKSIVLLLCALLAVPAATFSGTSAASAEKKSIEVLDIVMEGDILYAYSDNPNDPLKQLIVYNLQLAKVADTYCSGQQCSLDLSFLQRGYYIAVAVSKHNKYSEEIYVP
ncbi:MAG: hypothetical protein KatS3mg031_2292 [Chitinophagales bacterium]|nr:MAG: hypothetical protein KatS3mg031_2292 [Chitinophagales bacterium]